MIYVIEIDDMKAIVGFLLQSKLENVVVFVDKMLLVFGSK